MRKKLHNTVQGVEKRFPLKSQERFGQAGLDDCARIVMHYWPSLRESEKEME